MASHTLDYDPVPTVNPTGAPSGREQIDASPDMFGASIGRATAGLGQSVEKADNEGFGVLNLQEQMDAHTHAAELHSWQSDQVTDAQTSFLSLRGKAALEALPTFKEKVDDIHKQARDQAGNPYTAALVDAEGRRLTDVAYSGAARHAATERSSWEAKTAANAASDAGNRAAFLASQSPAPNLNDDLTVQQQLQRSDLEVTNLAAGQGYDQPAIDSEVAKNRGRNVANIVKQVAGDPASGDVSPNGLKRAFDFYKSQEDKIDAGSRVQIQNFLKGPLNQVAGVKIADEVMGRPPAQVPSQTVADIPANFVDAVRKTEGFSSRAKWDYKQYTNGFGTKAESPDEVIDLPTATARFNAAMTKAAKFVDGVNPNLDPGTRTALASLTFNAGEGWADAGLGAKVRAGDMAGAKELFLQYNKAGGETNEGLVMRRAREASWFGRGDVSPTEASQPSLNRGAAMLKIMDDPALQNRPQVQAAALSHLNKVYQAWDLQSSQQRASFDVTVKNSTAEALQTGDVKTPLDHAQFIENYGPSAGEAAFADYTANAQLGSDMRVAASLDPQGVADLRARYQPKPGDQFIAQSKRAAALDQAIQANEKAKAEDPASFVVQHTDEGAGLYRQFGDLTKDPAATPGMKTAYAQMFASQMLALQARLGVPREAQRVAPDWYAEPIRNEIQAAATSDDPKARSSVLSTINAQREFWGSYWPAVVPQIAPAGSAPLVKAIAAGADPVAMQRLLALPKGENPAKVLKEQNETTSRNMMTAVNVAFAPFLGSMVGLQKDRDYAGYADLGQKLAALYVRDGQSAEQAATSAFNALIGDRYTFKDTYRIPKTPAIDPDQVQLGAQIARSQLLTTKNGAPESPFGNIQLQINDLGVSDNESDSRRNYARDGVFVTSPRNDGLNIAYKNTFVAGADGRPILLTWDQLAKMGGTKEAQNNQLVHALSANEFQP